MRNKSEYALLIHVTFDIVYVRTGRKRRSKRHLDFGTYYGKLVE